jgi:hypothetical protein
MNKYIFYCGTGATLTVEAQTPEEALASLFPKAVLGYYEQPASETFSGKEATLLDDGRTFAELEQERGTKA